MLKSFRLTPFQGLFTKTIQKKEKKKLQNRIKIGKKFRAFFLL